MSVATTPSTKAQKDASEKAGIEAEARDKAKARETAAALGGEVSQPTAKELGAPLYPGATFNTLRSRVVGTSMAQYFWTTDDSQEQVISYFEKQTGLKRVSPTKLIITIGPDAMGKRVSIAIVTNPGGFGPGKTAIMIVKQ